MLPYRARLSPLAADFVRARKLVLNYSDVEKPSNGNAAASQSCGTTACSHPAPAPKAAVPMPGSTPAAQPTGAMFWWCDGPCGPAKAAVVSMEREASLRPMQLPQDRKWIVAVVKEIAAELKAGRISGAVLLVQSAATAMVYANRCPSIRAVVGTCHEAVEQGLREVGANVLVIEHPYKTLPQVKNILGRFVRGPRELSEDVKRQLAEMAGCG